MPRPWTRWPMPPCATVSRPSGKRSWRASGRRRKRLRLITSPKPIHGGRSSRPPASRRSSALVCPLLRKSLLRPFTRFRRFRLAVLCRARRFQRLQEAARRVRDLVDGASERRFVGTGRVRKSAQLANELQRRGADFLVRGRRLEIEECAYIPAHGPSVPCRSLVCLRQHAIFGFEILSGVGDELRVARMVDSLYPDNNFHQLRVVLADVLDQLGLGIGGPGHQNFAGV